MARIPLPPAQNKDGGDYYSHFRLPRQDWERFTAVARTRGIKPAALLRWLVTQTVQEHYVEVEKE